MFEGVNLGLLVAMVITGVAVIVLLIGLINCCRKNDTKIVDKKTYVFETESSEYEDSKSSSIEIFEKEKPPEVLPCEAKSKDAEKCLDVLKNKKVIPIRLTEDIVKKFNNLQNSDVTNHTGFLSQSTYSDMQDRVVPRKPTP